MGETGKQMPPCTELAYPGLRKLTGKTKELASGEAQEFRLFCCRCQETNCTFQFESLRKYIDHIKKVLFYLFKRYESDVITNGYLLLNTDSILILNHEALPVREKKESKLV